MSMAIGYNMKKRRMAEGGDVKGVHQQYNPSSKSTGTSLPGGHVRGARMARENEHGILKRPEETAQKREGMAKEAHQRTLEEMKSMRGQDRTNLAEGGEVCPTCNGRSGHDGMVDRIMSKYSEGGRVANEDEDDTDFKENEFDVMPEEDHLEEHETGANSGDELGDHDEDEREGDLVSRIMRSRSKRDRNPKPA